MALKRVTIKHPADEKQIDIWDLCSQFADQMVEDKSVFDLQVMYVDPYWNGERGDRAVYLETICPESEKWEILDSFAKSKGLKMPEWVKWSDSRGSGFKYTCTKEDWVKLSGSFNEGGFDWRLSGVINEAQLLESNARRDFLTRLIKPMVLDGAITIYQKDTPYPLVVAEMREDEISSALFRCGLSIGQIAPLLESSNIVFKAVGAKLSGANLLDDASHADKPWLVHHENDPVPADGSGWYTAARYFARELLKENLNFKRRNPRGFYCAIADKLFNAGIHPRNNRDKKYGGESVKKSLNRTGIQ